jgi:hypothetical protein
MILNPAEPDDSTGFIPHDMVRYAGEQTLQSLGFFGRIKDGESAGFRMTPEALYLEL